MNEDFFWKTVSSIKEGGGELSRLDIAEVLEFHNFVTSMLAKSCTFPLLAANFTIESYVSDDGFREFRAWLISQGEDKFYSAIKDPESIAEWLDPDAVDEIDGDSILSVAEEIYRELSGKDDFYEKVIMKSDPEIVQDWPDSKEAYRKIWPKLVDTYWNSELINEMH